MEPETPVKLGQFVGFVTRITALPRRPDLGPEYIALKNLAFKLAIHIATIAHLLDKTPVKFRDEERQFFDFPAIYSLIRISLENYANLYEIFFEDGSVDIILYRFYASCIQGLKLDSKNEIDEEELAPDSKDLLDYFRQKLKVSKFYKEQLTEAEQKSSLRIGTLYVKGQQGIRKNRNYVAILKAAGFPSSRLDTIAFLSNSNIHSDILAAGTIELLYNGDSPEFDVDDCIGTIVLILASLIDNYVKRFPEAKLFVQECPREMRLVEKVLASHGML